MNERMIVEKVSEVAELLKEVKDFEGLDAMALGFDIITTEEDGFYIFEGVEMLITFGGPNIWAEALSDGWVKVRGAWAFDTAVKDVYAPELCEMLEEVEAWKRETFDELEGVSR